MAGAYLAVGDSSWRVTITGSFDSGPLPSGYIENIRRFEEAIKAITHGGATSHKIDEKRPDNADAESITDSSEDIATETVEEFMPWPNTGNVTSKEIATAWIIGESTFKQKVYQGIYPKQLDVESMRNLWDVKAVTKALVSSNVQRRRKLQ